MITKAVQCPEDCANQFIQCYKSYFDQKTTSVLLSHIITYSSMNIGTKFSDTYCVDLYLHLNIGACKRENRLEQNSVPNLLLISTHNRCGQISIISHLLTNSAYTVYLVINYLHIKMFSKFLNYSNGKFKASLNYIATISNAKNPYQHEIPFLTFSHKIFNFRKNFFNFEVW